VGRNVTLKELGVDVSPADEPQQRAPAGAPVLTVTGLAGRGDMGTAALHQVDFTTAAGEIVAIAGVEGNGQAELEEVLFGLRPATAGHIHFAGREITHASTAQRLEAGIGIIPSDRYRRGVIRPLSVAENLSFDGIGAGAFGNAFRIRRRTVTACARELVDRFSIQSSRLDQPAGTLSGGNAQRLVLARTLSRDLRCLIAAQPTRGLDVGAMEFVWTQLDEARKAGVAILLLSTDLDEVMALADRCYVLYRGRLVASWARHDLDREKIGLAMGGIVDPAGPARPAQASPVGLPAQQGARSG
jgi:general nucleoside transport system ATP-binding protein